MLLVYILAGYIEIQREGVATAMEGEDSERRGYMQQQVWPVAGEVTYGGRR